MNLYEKKCVPCAGGTPPLGEQEVMKFLTELDGNWDISEGKKIEKSYRFRNFKEALVFVNKVGEIAEAEGHHPDIFLSWGLVKIVLWTHKIGGLTESDFILAAKCDRIR